MHDEGYMGLLPREIRHDPELSGSEKVFFAEITANVNIYGACLFSNGYITSLFRQTKTPRGKAEAKQVPVKISAITASRWVTALRKRDYIRAVYLCFPEGKAFRLLYPHTSKCYAKVTDGQKINYKNLRVAISKNVNEVVYTIVNGNEPPFTFMQLAEMCRLQRCKWQPQKCPAMCKDVKSTLKNQPDFTAINIFAKQCINIYISRILELIITKNNYIHTPPKSQNENPDSLTADSINANSGKQKTSPAQNSSQRILRTPITQEKPDTELIPFHAILKYFAKITGKVFKTVSCNAKTSITDWWGKGYKLDAFKYVIDVMTAHWNGTQFYNTALTMEHIFGPKFETYLNYKMPKKTDGNQDDPGLTPERLRMIQRMDRKRQLYLQGED